MIIFAGFQETIDEHKEVETFIRSLPLCFVEKDKIKAIYATANIQVLLLYKVC